MVTRERHSAGIRSRLFLRDLPLCCWRPFLQHHLIISLRTFCTFMAHINTLQEETAARTRQLPVSFFRPMHEPPLVVSPAPAPSPLHRSQSAITNSMQLVHSQLHTRRASCLHRQHAAQGTDHAEKKRNEDGRDGMHPIVTVRRAGAMPIYRIPNPTNRQVTFSKRRNGLLKKAYELSVLCDAEVGSIIFSAAGRLSEFASSSMPKLLERYQSYSNGLSSQKIMFQDVEFWRRQVLLLRDQISRQKALQSYMLGENLFSLDLNTIEMVEKTIEIAIDKVRVQKAQLIQAKAEESRRKEAWLKEENDVPTYKVFEVANLHAWKEQMLIKNKAPKVPCSVGGVMRSSVHDSIPLVEEDTCASTSSAFINQDIHSPPTLQAGLELFPIKPSG